MCNIIYDMILKSVQELGATSFVITSDMTGAQRISNKMAMLHDGRIGCRGPPKIYKTPSTRKSGISSRANPAAAAILPLRAASI